MAGVWLWVRREWVARWPVLIALGLLISLVGGITMAVAGGGRRAATAFDRFQQQTNAPELEVRFQPSDNLDETTFADQPTAAELADEVASVDGVLGTRAFTYLAATADPDGGFWSFVMEPGRGAAPTDPLIAGRLPRADAPDEVLINESARGIWHTDLGRTLRIYTLGPGQMRTFFGLEQSPAAGPVLDLRVVGVARDAEDISDLPEAVFVAGPAFLGRWGDQVLHMTGFAAVNASPDRLDQVTANINAKVQPRFAVGPISDNFAGRVDDTISVEVTVLSIFAVAAGVAGLLVIAQALSRATAGAGAEQNSLRALGFRRRQSIAATAAALVPALLLGVVGSVLLAVALSPLLPRGLARRAEPDPGVRVDAFVLASGAVTLAVVLAGLAIAASWLTSRPDPTAPGRAPRRAELVSKLAAALPPVPGLGTRFAFDRGAHRGPVVGLAGVVGAALLVGGLIGVSTIERSRDHLLDDTRLFGATWELDMEFDDPSAIGVVRQLAADADVADLGTTTQLLGNEGLIDVRGPSGQVEVGPVAYTSVKGSIQPVVSAGRPPGAGESIIGRQLASRLGASIGDTIVAEGFAGEVPLTVTGWYVDPGQDDLDGGFLVTPDTLDRLRAECSPNRDDFSCQLDPLGVSLALRDGADRATAISRLRAIAPDLALTARPSIVNNLAQIGATPWFLAAFLVLIGGAGLAHALIVGVRRRRGDLAIVRALGLRPAETRRVVIWQGVVMAVLGAAVGLVLGLMAGRLIWQRVAEGIGALVEVRVPLFVLVGAPVVAVALSLFIAMFTGRRAAGLNPATALRAE